MVFLILAVIGYLIASAVFWVQAPDRVPSHFDAAGHIDHWASKTSTMAVLLPIGVGIPIILGLPWPWAKRSAMLNVPYKSEWIDSGRSQGLTDRVIVFARLTGGLICILMGVILAVTFAGAGGRGIGRPMPSWALAVTVVGFLIAVGLCTWKLFRDLKPTWSPAG